MKTAMKLTTGILGIAMMAGGAWAQNTDAIDQARSVAKSLQQKQTTDTTAAVKTAAVPNTAKPAPGAPAPAVKPAVIPAAKPAATAPVTAKSEPIGHASRQQAKFSGARSCRTAGDRNRQLAKQDSRRRRGRERGSHWYGWQDSTDDERCRGS
jgi:hypothetical protein